MSSITKGKTTVAEAVQLLGPPSGEAIYPMVKEKGQRALFYGYVRVHKSVWRGMSKANKSLSLTIDESGTVTDLTLSVTG